MTRTLALILAAGLFVLSGCASTVTPDYSIKVARLPNGKYVAIPPSCPSWSAYASSPWDNQPFPQFGCASQRDLALMVDNPEDLLHGHALGPARGTTVAGSILRYDNNQTRGLIYPSSSVDTAVDTTTASTSASGLTGETSPGGGSSSSSSSSGSSSSGSSSSGGSSALSVQ